MCDTTSTGLSHANDSGIIHSAEGKKIMILIDLRWVPSRQSTPRASVRLHGLPRTMKCMSIYCPLNMCKCNSYTSFNICSIKTCLNWQFTYYLSIHIKQHFMNQHAFHIFIHKSYESNAHQHIIIKLIANKSHTGQTHSLNISYSQYTQ